MSSSAYSAVLQGLEPTIIEVEVEQTPGLPTLVLVGLATHAVAEAKERISTALATLQLSISSRRTVVNLAPTDLKKSSPALDLAIIVALLKKNSLLIADVHTTLFLGEIALDGRVKAVTGVLPIVHKARQLGFSKVVIPQQNYQQVSIIDTVEIIPIRNLQQLVRYFQTGKKPRYTKVTKQKKAKSTPTFFNNVMGQLLAKRALQIAAAGHHHLLFIGPPGSGKTKLAQSLLDLLPPLTKKESIETTAIYSTIQSNLDVLTNRPFRAPHHSISDVGLLGGGVNLLPAEVSLAHHGVLFLDELTEFSRRALEALRQPLVEKQIAISRVAGSVTYPTDFCLVAACNPCPCGFYGSSYKQCSCPPSIRQRYIRKLSGPLLDRIDLVVWLEPQKEILDMSQQKVDLDFIQQRIASTKEKLVHRDQNLSTLKTKLSKQALHILKIATTNQHLSTRAIIKSIQVAETIHHFDQNQEKLISKSEILEALQYRWKDQTA